MTAFKKIGITLKEDELAALNLRLKSLGYGSLADLARAVANGVITNRVLIDELAQSLVDKIASKLLAIVEQRPPVADYGRSSNLALVAEPSLKLASVMVGSEGFEPSITSARGS